MEVVRFNDVPFEKDESSNVGIRSYLSHTAIMSVNGRYPENGDVEVHDSEARIIGMSGMGVIVAGGEAAAFQTDDIAVIPPGEGYYFDECESLKIARTIISQK